MKAKDLFVLFCGTVLLAKIPTADAYTVIIQYSQAGNQSQHLQYAHQATMFPRVRLKDSLSKGSS
jgi:hypothetical protein